MKLRTTYKQKKNELKEIGYLRKQEDGSYLMFCDFCSNLNVKVNKSFHIKNRNKVKFWNKQITDKSLICFCCLFSWKELEISSSKKNSFRVYKSRYGNIE